MFFQMIIEPSILRLMHVCMYVCIPTCFISWFLATLIIWVLIQKRRLFRNCLRNISFFYFTYIRGYVLLFHHSFVSVDYVCSAFKKSKALMCGCDSFFLGLINVLNGSCLVRYWCQCKCHVSIWRDELIKLILRE